MVSDFKSLGGVVVLLRRTSNGRAILVDGWMKESRNGGRRDDQVNLYSPLERRDYLFSVVEAWRVRHFNYEKRGVNGASGDENGW